MNYKEYCDSNEAERIAKYVKRRTKEDADLLRRNLQTLNNKSIRIIINYANKKLKFDEPFREREHYERRFKYINLFCNLISENLKNEILLYYENQSNEYPFVYFCEVISCLKYDKPSDLNNFMESMYNEHR